MSDDADSSREQSAPTAAPSGFDWKAITPEDSPMTPIDIMQDPGRRDLSTAKIVEGDMAYPFSSQVYDYSDGTKVATGERFDLLTVAEEKPVALIFGSYT